MIAGVLPHPPRFLDISEVLTLHESLIEQFGGSHGIRDPGLLDSALSMPRQSFDGQFAHEVPFGMAAAYAFHLCKNHPFVDGNKRIALSCMVIFLHMNGWVLKVDDLSGAEQILAIAEGTLDKLGLTDWIGQYARPRPSLELREFFQRVDHASFVKTFLSLLPAVTSASPEELLKTVDEAVIAMPALEGLAQEQQEARIQQDTNREQMATTLGVAFCALYRLAEDMGYEW